MVEGEGHRQDAIYAFHILNYFIGDLVAASQVHKLFHTTFFTDKASPSTVACADRMCLSYLFLTLAKWTEFYDRYKKVIPEDCIADCKSLHKEIRRREILRFRNKVVGHIWDNDQGRPLTQQEIETAAEAIVRGDPKAFCKWCNNPGGNEYPDTVVSIVEHTRNRIVEEFNLTENDFFPEKGAT